MRSQKQMILDIIRASTEHLTAEQIYEAAKREHPSLAIGTVYRNLALLSEAAQVRRIEVPGEPTRYDKSLSPHEHLLCLRCGKMSDANLGGDLLPVLRKRTGEDVKSYQLSMLYICPECRAESSKDKI